ncbi:hypothetical protein [Microvirga sp. BSC39]|uniref:hypothetical protein n=1 Tax=Microvirga sp. BSC39 TaxID=1549810 RepID=UPI0004E868FD|nr:hypothetical protein [Microvirga sp. BSC39]KFG66736.1 hypothetical protein JH26_25650 [Microvirga sp. BSC39]
MSTLYDRILGVLAADVSSASIVALTVDVRAERDRLAAERAGIEAEALDLLTQPDTAKARRMQSADLEFEIERLDVALSQLETELGTARNREEQARKREQYERAKAAMATVGADLDARWNTLCNEMRQLLVQGCEAAKAVEKANADLPAGAAPLVAHPLLGEFVEGYQTCQPIFRTVHVPGFWKRDPNALMPVETILERNAA